jgi:hypothetical protein
MEQTKQITELTEQELHIAILNNTIQREILSSQIVLLTQEILRRQQQQAQQPKIQPSSINLPKLKKIQLPSSNTSGE